MKKVEFDINLAKQGAKVGLRMSAEPCAEIVCYDLEHHNKIDNKDYPILAIITDIKGKKHEEHYSIKGEYMPPAKSNMDLMLFLDEELTELEMAIHRRLNLLNGEFIGTAELDEEAKGMAAEVLDIARKQIKEEENSGLITPNREFFTFIYERLIYKYGENRSIDYMQSFKDRIDKLFPET